jgi:tRNA (cmo5U34)-methyltransferase
MDRGELKQTFDRQAASYDQKWSRLAAFRDAVHLLIGSVFSELPGDARVLCVGAGTGAEIVYLADRFPGWTFTAVEPSGGMLEAFRRRADDAGIGARCTLHEGYLDALAPTAPFDAATCLLVSQFILDAEARSEFFRSIAQRLRPGGLLANSELSADVNSADYQSLLEVWLRSIAGAGLSPEGIEQMCAAYRRDVAVLPAQDIESIILAGGFESPIQFFQAGLIRAWYARRAAEATDGFRP